MESLDALFSQRLQPSSPAGRANLWSRSSLLKEITQLLDEIDTWPGVVVRSDRHGLQFIAADATLGGLRWDGRLEVIFPVEIRDRLLAEEMATAGPHQPGADRVVWIVRKPADVDRAVWLLRVAYLRSFGNLETQVPSNSHLTAEAHYEKQR